MFLALRDIAHAKGRFALVGSVIALITVLLVMLTGLTEGLGKQNTAALEALDPDRVVFAGAAPGREPEIDFAESRVDDATAAAWAGVTEATPLGVGQTRLETDGEATAVAVLGLPAGTAVPGGTVPEDGVLLPADIAGTDAAGTAGSAGAPGTAGRSVTLGGETVAVRGTAAEEYHSHLPVVWADLATWRAVSHTDRPSVLLLSGGLDDAAAERAGQATGSRAVTLGEAFSGLGAYQSERGSLVTMQALLYGISALVIVAFLSVWTIQRTRDIAVLRALGAAKRYVLGDSLAQAAAVVLAGAVGGALVGWGLGALAAGAVPFALGWATVALPALGVTALGLAGAVLATRKVAAVDPMLALNA